MCSRRAKRRRKLRRCWCCEGTGFCWTLKMRGGKCIGGEDAPCPVCKKKVEPEL